MLPAESEVGDQLIYATSHLFIHAGHIYCNVYTTPWHPNPMDHIALLTTFLY